MTHPIPSPAAFNEFMSNLPRPKAPAAPPVNTGYYVDEMLKAALFIMNLGNDSEEAQYAAVRLIKDAHMLNRRHVEQSRLFLELSRRVVVLLQGTKTQWKKCDEILRDAKTQENIFVFPAPRAWTQSQAKKSSQVECECPTCRSSRI